MPPRTISSTVWTTLFVYWLPAARPQPSAWSSSARGTSRRMGPGSCRRHGGRCRLFEVRDANEPGILDRLEPAERHIGHGARGMPGIVQQVVGDEARGRDRQPPAALQVEHRAIDDVDGAAAGDLGIGLDVGHEQFDRGQVRGNRGAQTRREVRREQARVLGSGGVDDQIGVCHGLGDSLVQPDESRARRSGSPCKLLPRARWPSARFVGCGRRRDQEDVVDPVLTGRIDDRFFAAEKTAVRINRHAGRRSCRR